MAFVSYTRNFEDVMLNRVFANIPKGFFVDVGAHHPVADSTTYALYSRGWRGVDIDPLPEYASLWPQCRPDNVFLQAAAGNVGGSATFFSIEGYLQLATTTESMGRMYKDMGAPVVETTVPVITLDEVLARHRPHDPIHLISIDVEGGEKAVLEGIDLTRYRPWLIVLESVEPGRQTPTHAGWEHLLLDRGYEFAYFDRVNRFYVAKEHADLKQHFAYPPCVWDDFVDFRLDLTTKELERARAELAQLKQQVQP